MDYRVIAEFTYDRPTIEKGYANQTLYINLSTCTIESRPVTRQMKDIFIGGRGFGLWRLWNAVRDDTKWNDPENEINISSGPLGGTTVHPGAGKSLVVSISPLTNSIIDSNVGGHFGPLLKFSGWDALEIQGKADQEVIVLIDGNAGKVQIIEPPVQEVNSHLVGEQLTHMFADSDQDLADVSVVSSGQGAEHALFGCLNFSWYDTRRQTARYKQAGRGGIGTVFRDKKIRALVVKCKTSGTDLNHSSDPQRVARVGKKINQEIVSLDPTQNRMREVGTIHLVEIMSDYDILPVRNFKYGGHPDAPRLGVQVFLQKFSQKTPDNCWRGCTMSCSHGVDCFTLQTGPYKGQPVHVDGPEYETAAGCGSNLGIFDPDAVIEINFYCDTYGLDTISFGTAMAFVMECFENGILNQERTGGLSLTWGNAGAVLEVLHQIGRGEGLGLTVGQGIRRMKAMFAAQFGADPAFLNDIGMESKGLEYSEYVTKESLAMQGGYGLTLKGPQHDEAWLIFMDQVNNQLPTFEDKAAALHYFPMWRTWFGLNGLCKLIWNDVVPEDNALTSEPAKVPEHVHNFIEFFSGVTGREVKSGDDLILMSERVYNFQRVFNIRLGYGRRFNDAVPYRSMGPVTEEEYLSRQERYDRQLVDLVGLPVDQVASMDASGKMAALRRYREGQYEKLTDAVYLRRGWTRNGVPTVEKLRELGIDWPDVIQVVEKYL